MRLFSASSMGRVFQRADGTWSANYELNANVVRFLSSKSEDEDEDGEFSF